MNRNDFNDYAILLWSGNQIINDAVVKTAKTDLIFTFVPRYLYFHISVLDYQNVLSVWSMEQISFCQILPVSINSYTKDHIGVTKSL